MNAFLTIVKSLFLLLCNIRGVVAWASTKNGIVRRPSTIGTSTPKHGSTQAMVSGDTASTTPLPSSLKSLDSLSSFPAKQEGWIVFVDHSKPSLEKGAAATLDAFLSLAPASRVTVKAAFLPKQPKSGGQPWVRCVSVEKSIAMEIFGVDSVDKVYRILTKHMGLWVSANASYVFRKSNFIRDNDTCVDHNLCASTTSFALSIALASQQGISRRSCRCLQYKYKANGFLEAGKVSLAIEAYQKALQAAQGDEKQEGVIFFLRSAAYLQRAAEHRDELKDIVQDLTKMIPSPNTLVSLLDVAYYSPLSGAVFRRILQDSARQERSFRGTQYRHGLYQYALLQAAQDALRATEILPNYAAAWVRAADILGELWKLSEAVIYYERAIALDETLRPTLIPVITRLQRRQELLAEARSYRWSEDTLRLALDVAG